MILFAFTSDQIAAGGKAWVDAIAAILGAIIGQVGILVLAAIAVYQNINKQLPQEVKDRLDRYNDRLDRVAIATVAAAPEEKKEEVAQAVAPTPVPVAPEIPPVQTEPPKPEKPLEPLIE